MQVMPHRIVNTKFGIAEMESIELRIGLSQYRIFTKFLMAKGIHDNNIMVIFIENVGTKYQSNSSLTLLCLLCLCGKCITQNTSVVRWRKSL